MSFTARIAQRTVGRIYRDQIALRDHVAEAGIHDEAVSLNQRATTERRNGARTGWQMRGEYVLPTRSRARPALSPYNSLTIH